MWLFSCSNFLFLFISYMPALPWKKNVLSLDMGLCNLSFHFLPAWRRVVVFVVYVCMYVWVSCACVWWCYVCRRWTLLLSTNKPTPLNTPFRFKRAQTNERYNYDIRRNNATTKTLKTYPWIIGKLGKKKINLIKLNENHTIGKLKKKIWNKKMQKTTPIGTLRNS